MSSLFCYNSDRGLNSQKNRFRQMEKGTLIVRNTFPQLPWQTIENPTFIKCKNGGTLLTSGWCMFPPLILVSLSKFSSFYI